MKAAFGTAALCLAMTIAMFGVLIGQGETDVVRLFLVIAGASAAGGAVLFGLAVYEWYRSLRSVRPGADNAGPPAGAVGSIDSAPIGLRDDHTGSTVMMVVGTLIGFAGIPMLIGQFEEPTASVELFPWLFCAGSLMLLSGIALRLRRSAGVR